MNEPRDFDRLEAERLRRLRECFNADRPTKNEVRAALQRWHLAQIRPERSLPVRAGWVIVGAMLVSGVAVAGTRVVQLPVWESLTSWSKTAGAPVVPESKQLSRCFVQRAAHRTECKPSADLELAPGEQVTLVMNDVSTELVGPGIAHLRFEVRSGTWMSQYEPRGWAPVVPASHPAPTANGTASRGQLTEHGLSGGDIQKHNATASAPKRPSTVPADADTTVPPLGTSPAGPLSGAWARAASALRHGDDLAARSALSEISRGSDPAARDAALLAEAQLDLAAARREKALPLLNELARNGSTAFVRQRARDILVSGK